MKQSIRLALISALTLVLCFVPGKYTFADSVSVKPFLAFGADLSTKEKAQVMKQFGITNEELADYQTITVTNKEEHQYLDVLLQSSSNNENTLFQRYCNWILQQNCNKFVCNNA